MPLCCEIESGVSGAIFAATGSPMKGSVYPLSRCRSLSPFTASARAAWPTPSPGSSTSVPGSPCTDDVKADAEVAVALMPAGP